MAVLRGIVAGAPWLADVAPVELLGASGCQQIEAVGAGGVWALRIWWEWPAGALWPHLGWLEEAISPDGRVWVRGCGRWPSWDAGPDAEVLDPVEHLLGEEERWQLRDRLALEVVLLPRPVMEIVEPPSMEELDDWLEMACRP